MLFSYVLASCVLVLAQGKTEIPLKKINILDDGYSAATYVLAAEIKIGGSTFDMMVDTSANDILVVSNTCMIYRSFGNCDPFPGSPENVNSTISGYDVVAHKNNLHVKGGYQCYDDNRRLDIDTYKDNIGIGSLAIDDQYFGVIQKQPKNMWHGNVTGSLGLSFTGNSDLSGNFRKIEFKLFLSASVEEGAISDEFSICINKTTGNGKLMLGAGDKKEMTYVPMVKNGDIYDGYRMNVSVSYGDDTLMSSKDNGKGVLLDTGYDRLFVFPQTAMAQFTFTICQALKEVDYICIGETGHSYDVQTPYIISITEADLQSLPSLEFSIGSDIKIIVKSDEYYGCYVNPETNEVEYHLAIESHEDGLKLDKSVLGAMFFKGKYIHFDRKNHQIGIEEVEAC